MQNIKVEGHRITGLHRPFADLHTFRLGVWHRHIVFLIGVKTRLGQPAGWQDRFGPFMTAGNATERGFCHGIKRAPKTHILLAVDKIIGPVLMPRGGFGCAGFFH